MTNLIPQTKNKLKRASRNPERLCSPTQIIQPRLRLFVAASLFSVSSLLAWAIFGRIPVTVTGNASFVAPETLREIPSGAEGLIYFSEDIKEDVRNNLLKLSSTIETKIEEIKNEKLTLDQYREIFKTISTYAKTYSQLTLESDKRPKILIRKKESNEISKKVNLSSTEPIAYVLSTKAATTYIQAMTQYRLANRLYNLEQENHAEVSNKSKEIFNVLKNQLDILESLVKEGIVSEDDFTEKRQQLLTVERGVIDQDQSLEKAKATLRTKLGELVATIYDTSQQVQIQPLGKSTIVSKLIQSGQHVDQGQLVTIVSTSKTLSNPKLITGLFPLKSLQGLEPGIKVLVSPVNADVNTYGQIKGVISKFSPIPIDKENAIYKVGSAARASSLFANNTSMTMASIQLNASETKSGYDWSSSKGPDYSIPLGTEAEITAIIRNRRPISVLLPFLRGVTGQK